MSDCHHIEICPQVDLDTSEIPPRPAAIKTLTIESGSDTNWEGDDRWLLTMTVNGVTLELWQGDGWQIQHRHSVVSAWAALGLTEDNDDIDDYLIALAREFDRAHTTAIADAHAQLGEHVAKQLTEAAKAPRTIYRCSGCGRLDEQHPFNACDGADWEAVA